MMSPEVEGESYTHRGEPASLSMYILPKLCEKNIWLIARIKKPGISLTPFTKITSGKQKVWSKAKCFCFWKQQRRKGDGEMTR